MARSSGSQASIGTLRWLALGTVAANLGVLIAHDAAHRELGVLLVAWQQAFVYSVIVPGPLVAALLLLRRHLRHGFALLLVSMVGSCLFGAYHHYVAISPDHVKHLPPGEAQHLFRQTALWMLVLESAGVWIAALGLRRSPPAAQTASKE